MVLLKTLFLLLLQYPHSTLSHSSSSPSSLPFPNLDHKFSHHSLQTDKAALLEFKRTIISDPYSTLSNWHESVHVCNFTGIHCDERHHHRVTHLILHESDLVGPLSPSLSNLTSLHTLEILHSPLYGILPHEFSSLRNLHHLLLKGLNLHGFIPESFSHLTKLKLLYIRESGLSGSLPPSIFLNCTLLRNLDLSGNNLSGKIPEEIGNCHSLWNLNLYNNDFSGKLPLSLTNLSLLNLDVENNHLSGELPCDIVSKLHHLLYLHLSYNHMISHDGNTNLVPFFVALGNCTSLEELELAGMGLGGRFFDGVISRLGSHLRNLVLQENQIFGSVPPNLANLSSLRILDLTSNLLNGTISPEIYKLSSLEQLFLSHNLFKTSIPKALGECVHLGLLDLSHNEFSGQIPESIGNLATLNYLFLNNNFLSGTIPSSLGKCIDLYKLDLSYNRLSGNIPPMLFSGLKEIRMFINMSHNHLEGPLPIELSKLEKIQEVDLSSNHLNGTIFPQIRACSAVANINFSNNFLQGDLPETLGDLKNLESLDVSRNQLSGLIPMNLSTIQTLIFINFSYNNLEGIIPSGGIFISASNLSFLGNPHLCGIKIGISLCSQNKRHSVFHKGILLIIFILVIFISMFLLICCGIKHKHKKVMVSSDVSHDIYNFPRITYRQLSEATDGFDKKNLVGSGSHGQVYRGIFPNGTPIAVKVLLHLDSKNDNSSKNNTNDDDDASTKSFNRECQVLKRIRHRNLMKIITACSSPDFKALVFPYMAKGSLEKCLYNPHSDLCIIQRVSICSDIAQGLAYLHHHSPVRIIHCDLKPSNVLLSHDMTALVSDFGISRLVNNGGVHDHSMEINSSSSTFVQGSIGYIAPEYGLGSSASRKRDVYSFGILILEVVTRKKPTDERFGGELSLEKWVRIHYPREIEKVMDPALMAMKASLVKSQDVKTKWEFAFMELIEMGILCTQESPSMRPTMLDVAHDLDRLKKYIS